VAGTLNILHAQLFIFAHNSINKVKQLIFHCQIQFFPDVIKFDLIARRLNAVNNCDTIINSLRVIYEFNRKVKDKKQPKINLRLCGLNKFKF